jgi:hypothetical protein
MTKRPESRTDVSEKNRPRVARGRQRSAFIMGSILLCKAVARVTFTRSEATATPLLFNRGRT